MKKILTITLAITVLLLIPPATFAQSPSVTIESQQPAENITPGEKFQIKLDLLNTGENTAKNVSVQLKASYPISVIGLSEKNINELSEDEEEQLNFSLKIEETAIEGTYPLEFLINYEDDSGNTYTKNYVANISVKGEKELTLVLSESSKTDIYSDDEATLTFNIMNNGTASVESLAAEATAEGSLKVSWNSKEHLIGKINPQESTSFKLTIETSEKTKTDNYPLKIQLNGDNYSLEKTFQIPVKSLPNITLESLETENLYPNKNEALLTVYIVNEGNKTGEEIEGRLLPKYPFSTEETTQYIQEIEVNKTGKMDFWLNVDEDAKPGNYSLNLSLEYKAWGEKFSETLKIPVKVQEGERLQMKLWWFIPILIAILAGAYVIKQRIQK